MITLKEIKEKLVDRYEPEELVLLLGLTVEDIIEEFTEEIYLNLKELDIYDDTEYWGDG